jgi:hypothetical protein
MTAAQHFIDQAFDDHAADPRGVAARLDHGFALLAEAPELADAFARLTEHVLLGHLDDGAALARWIGQLAPFSAENAGLGPTLERMRAAIALAGGGTVIATDLSAAERVRAHGNALLASTRRRDWVRVGALLDSAGDLAEHTADPAALRAFAAIANNLAGDLRFYHPRHRDDAGYRDQMVAAARIARDAWYRAGGWLEQERADYQLALCLAAAGAGREAVDHAGSCWNICRLNGADDAECFFALEALAYAQAAADRHAEAAAARAQMTERLKLIDDAGLRAYAEKQLAAVDTAIG